VLGALKRLGPWSLANRFRFILPCGSGATWLSDRALGQLDSRYDDVGIVTMPYAPRTAPGLRWSGSLAERIGHLVTPHYGVFIVARIQRDQR
jgi:hypothetical protein